VGCARSVREFQTAGCGTDIAFTKSRIRLQVSARRNFAGPGLLNSFYRMELTDQLGFRFQPPERRVWTVRALVAAVRTLVEREYSDAWVEGEISNFRAPDSGHLYFTLKDGNAQIRVVMFSSKARLLRVRPADGMQVVVRGRVTIYEERGELQIAAEYIEPKGAGGLQVAFEQLKAKLEAEGLFAAERKKPIPTLPARIGIVTSPQAAALRDILNILRRRHHTANAVIYPAQVQGDSAAAEVVSGIRYFNQSRSVEVIIVGRGGGSAEDLAAFNDEGLARAVAASEIPIISAVGHETDFTICDFVADLRAPTPSAAAELVIRSRVEIENQAEAVRERLVRAMERRLAGGPKRADGAGAAWGIRSDDGPNTAAAAEARRFDIPLRTWRAAGAGADSTPLGNRGRGGTALRCAARAGGYAWGITDANVSPGGRNEEFVVAVSSACRTHGQGAGNAFATGDPGAGVCAGV
jgi:exodeoxyribonuclease VII large subunit